jgi:hypothetical protein
MVSPELTLKLIERSRPRRRLAGGQLPLLVLVGVLLGVVLAGSTSPHLPPLVTPALAVMLAVLLVAVTRWRVKRQQLRALRWKRAHEAVLLEEWASARQRLADMLSQPVDSTTVRTQGLLGLAAVADHCHQYQSSQLLYEEVLKSGAGQPAQLHAAAIGLAVAMLRNEELTSAVQLIDQLTRQDWPRSWKAHLELVRLFREVVMGQYDDVLASADSRRELFRECLSTRSGYGYGLMALGYHRRGRADLAGRLWHDATLLIAADKLLDRFPMLSELADQYPACKVPL